MAIDLLVLSMIQAPEVEHWIMHYELSDCEWSVIKPMLPNKPHGIPRVDDRRVLNGIFWALRSGAHDAAVWMIDTSIVRVHQHGACIAGNSKQDMGRSRGGWTSKVHAVVDANGLPVRLGLSPGEAHDNRLCLVLLAGLRPRTMVLAERGYDADWIREFVNHQGA